MLGGEMPAWTTKRGARRLIARNLAVELPDGTLQLVTGDYRLSSESPSGAGASLLEMLRQFPVDPSWWDDRAVIKYWPDQGQAA